MLISLPPSLPPSLSHSPPLLFYGRYNLENFFEPLAGKYGLHGRTAAERAEEATFLASVDLDTEGLRACAMYEVRAGPWALQLKAHGHARAGKSTAPVSCL